MPAKSPLEDLTEAGINIAKEAVHIEYNSNNGPFPAAGKQIDIGGVPHIIKPENCELENMEKVLPAPTRIRTHIAVRFLESFLDYVGRFKLPSTSIFVDGDVKNGVRATAIFDYPDKDAPAWGSHRATYRTQPSPEWERWLQVNKKDLNQQEFAEFVEDNSRFFVRPYGSEMMTIAREIELKQNVEWKGSVRLDNGDTALNYVSTTKVGGAGEIEVPKAFLVALRPYRGGLAYEIEARLRVRLNQDQKLVIRFELLRIEDLLQTAMEEIIEKIKDSTGIAPLIGDVPDMR
jgi:uncharacterized protein YfdQ (DUF2303 family)